MKENRIYFLKITVFFFSGHLFPILIVVILPAHSEIETSSSSHSSERLLSSSLPLSVTEGGFFPAVFTDYDVSTFYHISQKTQLLVLDIVFSSAQELTLILFFKLLSLSFVYTASKFFIFPPFFAHVIL